MSKIAGGRIISRPVIPRAEFIALIAALMALNALAIDIMLPALPNIAASLGLNNENDRQLVISSYLIGVGIGQLFFGPITDRFGRRAPLFFGFAIYIVTSLAAVVAPGFAILLLLRFVQGLGTASFRVLALAIVRDRYEGRAMAEIMSLVFMVFMVVPIAAPGIGQLILFLGPWQMIFYFVAFIGVLTGVWAFFRLAETLDPANRRPLTPDVIIDGFRIVVTNRFSFSYAIAGMFMFGALIGLLNSSQQVFVDVYGLGVWFPLAFAGIASLMAIASFLNSRIVGRFGMRRIAHFALIIFTLSSVILTLVSFTGPVPLVIFYSLIGINFFMFSWSSANMNSLSMQPLGNVAGTAASTFGFFQTLGGAIIGLWIGRMFDGSVTPIAAGFAAAGIIAILFALVAEKGKLFGVGEE